MEKRMSRVLSHETFETRTTEKVPEEPKASLLKKARRS
jgi:hypothetical protein